MEMEQDLVDQQSVGLRFYMKEEAFLLSILKEVVLVWDRGSEM